LGGEEWERMVKWYLSRWRISVGDVVENMEIEEEVDFACGPVTSSAKRQLVEDDGDPAIPTAARQVCAKTQAAVNYMAPRLVAIICMS
jgi:predicted P-loop ATPase/GTPase